MVLYTLCILLHTKKLSTCSSLSRLPSPSSKKLHPEETSWACIQSEHRHPVGPESGPSTSSGRSLGRWLTGRREERDTVSIVKETEEEGSKGGRAIEEMRAEEHPIKMQVTPSISSHVLFFPHALFAHTQTDWYAQQTRYINYKKTFYL